MQLHQHIHMSLNSDLYSVGLAKLGGGVMFLYFKLEMGERWVVPLPPGSTIAYCTCLVSEYYAFTTAFSDKEV